MANVGDNAGEVNQRERLRSDDADYVAETWVVS